MRIVLLGSPSDVGGANTECWHTLKLWRGGGLDVSVVPTWEVAPEWAARLGSIGCNIHAAKPGRLREVPGLAGSLVAAFCNTRFLAVADEIRGLGCRVVWLGCMNFLFSAEKLHYARRGLFEAHVFQSQYQADQLTPQLDRCRTGEHGHARAVIAGALDAAEFPFRPLRHKPGEIFCAGRIGRANVEKLRPTYWEILKRTPHPLRAEFLGWSPELELGAGPPPHFAAVHPAGAEDIRPFLARQHCLVQLNNMAVENWPRVGLEAMAAGVPIVAEDKGGWRAMVASGRTGWLVSSDAEAAYRIADMAYREQDRVGLLVAARQRVEQLCDPAALWPKWKQLFEEVENATCGTAAAGREVSLAG